MSWRPSTRFDSIMTPIIISAVSPPSNCCACGTDQIMAETVMDRILTMFSATSTCFLCCLELFPWLQSIYKMAHELRCTKDPAARRKLTIILGVNPALRSFSPQSRTNSAL